MVRGGCLSRAPREVAGIIGDKAIRADYYSKRRGGDRFRVGDYSPRATRYGCGIAEGVITGDTGHLPSPAAQFSSTEMGDTAMSSAVTFIRNRPSCATAY